MNIQPLMLKVDLGDRSYPVFIGENLFTQDLLRRYIRGKQVLIVSNPTVAGFYLDATKSACSDLQCDIALVPDGEEYKTLATVNEIFDTLVAHKHRRSTTLIALGGGVIGDMTGFAAACYQRGADFIQIPTSLLAQVDAAIGGKTAVNHPKAKNMIGTFYQPRCVIVDINTLKTLPDRELRAGIAEIVKSALIWDADFFEWLEKNILKMLARDSRSLVYAIERSCAIKIKIVTMDEKEADIRALLNLGHTFAHAIELEQGYGVWLHGEAVAIGIVLAADLSHRLSWFEKDSLLRVKNLLTMAELPIRLPQSSSETKLLDYMGIDKKRDDGGLRFVLLKGIGNAILTTDIDKSLVQKVVLANRVGEDSD
jgi:3-dehydroquinate synthase